LSELHKKKCFTSHTQLLFSPGLYDLGRDFILHDLNNFSIIGNHSTFQCVSPSIGIAIINVTNVVVQGVQIVHCSKNYSTVIANTIPDWIYAKMSTFQWDAAMYLHHCESVIIKTVLIIVEVSTNGLIIINAMLWSELINVGVTATSSQSHKNHTTITNGLIVI